MTIADAGGSGRAVAARYAELRSVIESVPRPFTHPVEVVAVTKGFGPDAIEQAVAAGCTTIGENYANELLTKRSMIERLGPAVQFIGHLQSNKVRQLAGLVDLWASLDRKSVLDEVARRAPESTVLIQVNSTGEASKSGCSPDETEQLVEHGRLLGLVVAGLMTIGPTTGDSGRTTDAFVLTRRLVDQLGLSVCSMGMSGDLTLAVALGSTHVRLGTALFGARPARR